MDILEIIDKKRLSKTLSKEEIAYFVKGYTNGSIPDYQMSALLMAICINGMNEQETFYLTEQMILSGEVLNLSNIDGLTVDKHSTGGISDTTTIPLIPILACAGLKSVKMSGGGLGFTGGTADKLQVFENINITPNINDAISQVKEIGCAMCTQSSKLAPADKKIYALRDTTSTVESMPLIAASVMSKKIACNNDIIVLDVKCGNGAFMKDAKSAKELSKIMVRIGKNFNKKVQALITDMSQPLGNGIGCSLEIKDAIEVLQGKQSLLSNLVKEIAIETMVLSEMYTYKTANEKYQEIISTKQGLQKLKELVEYQGGNFDSTMSKISSLKPTDVFVAEQDGYIASYNAQNLGYLVRDMGGGRKEIDDKINLDCGIYAYKKIGDKVTKGEVLFDIYNMENKLSIPEIKATLASCFVISPKKVKPKTLVYSIIK